MTEIRIDELIAQLLELETLLKTKLKMEDQKTPLMGAVAEPQADEVVITPEGPIKPLLPQEFDASLPEPEITDNSTADGLSADQKLEG